MAARPTLGQTIKGLRTRLNLTVREMSAKVGIPASTLSKIENDRLTLTYDKLLQLSERLDISIAELFSSDESETPKTASARRSIGRLADSIRVETDNYDYNYLCTDLQQKMMTPILVTIRAKSVEEFGEFLRHPGEEFIYVVKGSVDVHTDVYKPVTLGEGEAIYLDSSMGHAYVTTAGHDDALVLGVCAAHAGDVMDLHDPLVRQLGS